jgi:hypothetical protein
MVHGGNADNRVHRAEVRKKIAASGRCLFCPPHGGENYGYGGDRHGKFFWDEENMKLGFRASKPKAKK